MARVRANPSGRGGAVLEVRKPVHTGLRGPGPCQSFASLSRLTPSTSDRAGPLSAWRPEIFISQALTARPRVERSNPVRCTVAPISPCSGADSFRPGEAASWKSRSGWGLDARRRCSHRSFRYREVCVESWATPYSTVTSLLDGSTHIDHGKCERAPLARSLPVAASLRAGGSSRGRGEFRLDLDLEQRSGARLKFAVDDPGVSEQHIQAAIGGEP